MKIEPLPFGARYSRRSRVGLRATAAEVKLALKSHTNHVLSKCYRRARFSNRALAGEVIIDISFGVDGVANAVDASSSITGAEELLACLRHTLRGAALRRYTMTRTRAWVHVHFTPSKQPMPPSKPPMPPPLKPGYPLPKGVCLHVRHPVPEDLLRSGALRLDVTDYDEEYARSLRQASLNANHKAALERWRREGGKGPAPQRRVLPPNTSQFGYGSWTLSLRLVRSYFMANTGAYRECYINALKRTKGLRGELFLRGAFDVGGTFSARVASTTVRDKELVACMVRRVSEVWHHPIEHTDNPLLQLDAYAITIHFIFHPEIPPVTKPPPTTASKEQIAAFAQRRLAEGDAKTAYRWLTALLASAPDGCTSCEWAVWRLRAHTQMVPFVSASHLPFLKQALTHITNTTCPCVRTGCEKLLLETISRSPVFGSPGGTLGLSALTQVWVRYVHLLVNSVLTLPNLLETQRKLANELYELGGCTEAMPHLKWLVHHFAHNPEADRKYWAQSMKSLHKKCTLRIPR